MKVLAPMLLILAVASSGCVDVGCGKMFSTAATWSQPGLYDRMPSPGQRDGYSVSDQSPEPVKSATRETSTESEGLLVERHGGVNYSIARTKSLTPRETGERLNETFRVLDLGTPALQDWSFKWGSEC